MTERRAQVGSVELVYETIGDPDDAPMLLVMGLGMQLIHWDLGLCELLAQRGFQVIRFDNRDAGLSTKIRGPLPSVMRLMAGLPARVVADLRGRDREEHGTRRSTSPPRRHAAGPGRANDEH